MTRFGDPEPLTSDHVLEGFDCGVESLNSWLAKHALQAMGAGTARTFVVVDAEQGRVVGYQAIAVASIAPADAMARAAKGVGRHPIPAALLARLAIDLTAQRQGLGAWLLRDAMLRTLHAAEEVGIRVMLVHAFDNGARAFYERFGFEASPTDPLNLQILLKDVRASLDAVGD